MNKSLVPVIIDHIGRRYNCDAGYYDIYLWLSLAVCRWRCFNVLKTSFNKTGNVSFYRIVAAYDFLCYYLLCGDCNGQMTIMANWGFPMYWGTNRNFASTMRTRICIYLYRKHNNCLARFVWLVTDVKRDEMPYSWKTPAGCHHDHIFHQVHYSCRCLINRFMCILVGIVRHKIIDSDQSIAHAYYELYTVWWYTELDYTNKI